jgi:hypothetical protein
MLMLIRVTYYEVDRRVSTSGKSSVYSLLYHVQNGSWANEYGVVKRPKCEAFPIRLNRVEL